MLDEHIARHRGSGHHRNERLPGAVTSPNYRLVRYADDWCLLVSGTKDDAETLREENRRVLVQMGFAPVSERP